MRWAVIVAVLLSKPTGYTYHFRLACFMFFFLFSKRNTYNLIYTKSNAFTMRTIHCLYFSIAIHSFWSWPLRYRITHFIQLNWILLEVYLLLLSIQCRIFTRPSNCGILSLSHSEFLFFLSKYIFSLKMYESISLFTFFKLKFHTDLE